MKTVLIYGATAALAQTTAENFAKDGWKLILAARDMKKSDDIANHLKVRYNAEVRTLHFDAMNTQTYTASFEAALQFSPEIDAVLIAHGSLPVQDKLDGNLDEINREITINSLSVINLLNIAANYFIPKKKGMIAVISSVAGERSRQSNYVYGSSKAFVSSYSQGLRNRLYHKEVAVLTIKPGFVDTPMTDHLTKNFLFAKDDAVGKRIFEAMNAGKSGVIYVPRYWRLIMCIVKSIPESMFMKMKM